MIKPELEFLHTNEDLYIDAVWDYARATRVLLERLHRYWNMDEEVLYKDLIMEGGIVEALNIFLDEYYNCRQKH